MNQKTQSSTWSENTWLSLSSNRAWCSESQAHLEALFPSSLMQSSQQYWEIGPLDTS
jgi:hypothetical protein